MISPYDCAREFNKLIFDASNNDNDFQTRIYKWVQAQVFYYVLTGTSLRLRLDEYLSSYDTAIDYGNFSQLAVDNTSGERTISPIRRFIHMLFPKY